MVSLPEHRRPTPSVQVSYVKLCVCPPALIVVRRLRSVREPTEDPTHLGDRRARVGLMPIKDCQCVLDTVYAPTVGRGKALHKP